MHEMKTLVISLLVTLFPSVAVAASAPPELPSCAHNFSDFNCFRQNLESIYENDNDLFWRSWKYQESKAKSCSSVSFTSNFISLVKKSDGELAEAMAQSVENMILSKLDCFLAAAEKLDYSTKEHLIRYYIMTPLYHEESGILPIIEKELKKKNFPKFKKLYLSIRKNR
jgi:hypothetical protein